MILFYVIGGRRGCSETTLPPRIHLKMDDLKQQLKAVKLREPSEPTRDYSNPKTAGFLLPSEITEYQEKVLNVNTERWLEILQDETFPTEYCPLYLKEAEMIVAVYDRLYKNLDDPLKASVNWRQNLSSAEIDLVKEMESRLQKVMDKFLRSNSDCLFVKTSSRSAKDAPMAQARFKEMYLDLLSKETEGAERNENIQIMCLLKAAFMAMRVRSSSEVMDMAMRSERIHQDLILALEFREKFCENFVVRTFVEIDVDMEFRGFVFQGMLAAVSQYNYLIFSPRLVEQKEILQARIEKFYAEIIRPKLESNHFEKDFIIDFAVGRKDQRLWVIEINPFLVTTDAALFSWEHERSILEGKEGFHFRITTRPKPGAKTMLPHSVKALMAL